MCSVFSGTRAPKRAASHRAALESAFKVAFIERSRGCARPSARGLAQSSLESAFSGVYRAFQRVRAPKRARPRTEQPGECV